MSMETDGLRQRAGKAADAPAGDASKVPAKVEGQSRIISILDVIRILLTLIVVTLGGSYYLTSGASFTFGYRPWFFNLPQVHRYFKGPLQLTPEQLSLYNGTDPNLPMYLVVNGSIFDVSSGRGMYGPGASYNTFVGREASRAFVTGCFLEDRTHDLRGAYKAFMPLDDPEEVISNSERKVRHEREVREAKQQVLSTINYWETFYRTSPKYTEVGKVVGLQKPTGPPPKLCSYAEQNRPMRTSPKAE